MKASLYTSFQWKIIALTLAVSLTPLGLLGGVLYHQYSGMITEKVEEQIRYRASAQAQAVELFLKERAAVLWGMAETHGFEQMVDPTYLRRVFQVMNATAGAFVDLGVIDGNGQHLTYVGPYRLEGLNYSHQPWFAEVMGRGVYVSDVFMGYRQIPHFIIAVRRGEGARTWVLRATIDPEVFGAMVRAAQVGRTGEAYIVNAEGIYQTRPRFGGEILGKSDIDPSLFGGDGYVMTGKGPDGHVVLYSGKWLKNHTWLLVVSQETSEELRGLWAARKVQAMVMGLGILAIVLTTVLTARRSVGRLREAEESMHRLNAQLIQSEKLAALGKLAAGVAHEINNPLAVILQMTGWMEDLLGEEEFKGSKNFEEFRKCTRKIEEHVERARKIVHGMLGYARRMEPRQEDVDVNRILEQTAGLLANYARNQNIQIQTNLSPDLPIIASDQAQLQQVFLNLMTNAIDAIGKDGSVRVESRLEAGFVAVSVSDDGPGISPEHQRRVFEPFFTTKEGGKGTGLGLWISYSIMEKLGGRIAVQSEKGRGTTFTVEIPAVLPEKK